MNLDQFIADSRRVCDAATAGPWAWRWPFGGHSGPILVRPKGVFVIVDATRLGMQGATLRFADRKPQDKGGILHHADRFMPDVTPQRPDYQEPTNPDMQFIAHARTALPTALDISESQRREIERLTKRVKELEYGMIGKVARP